MNYFSARRVISLIMFLVFATMLVDGTFPPTKVPDVFNYMDTAYSPTGSYVNYHVMNMSEYPYYVYHPIEMHYGDTFYVEHSYLFHKKLRLRYKDIRGVDRTAASGTTMGTPWVNGLLILFIIYCLLNIPAHKVIRNSALNDKLMVVAMFVCLSFTVYYVVFGHGDPIGSHSHFAYPNQ